MKNCSLRWVTAKDAEELSALAVPMAWKTYPYVDTKVLERYIGKELMPESIVKALGNGISYAFIDTKEGTAGYFAFSTEGEKLHIEKLYICEEFRGRGIGSEIMEWFVNKSKNEGYRIIELVVVDLNVPAIRFYKKFGFRRVTAEKGYTVKRSIMQRTFRAAELLNSYYI